MEIDVNPDPQDLNKSIFSGRKWWQWLCLMASFTIVSVFTIVLGDKIGSTANGLICALIVVPLGYVGVFQKNSMDFFEYYKEKRRNQKGENIFVYVSDKKYKD